MRIYLLGQMATVFAAGHLLQVFGFGWPAAIVGAITLLLSIALSLLGLQFFGLAGAVAGSTASLVVWECWALNKVAKALGTSIAQMIGLDQAWKVIVVVASVRARRPHPLLRAGHIRLCASRREVLGLCDGRAAWVCAHEHASVAHISPSLAAEATPDGRTSWASTFSGVCLVVEHTPRILFLKGTRVESFGRKECFFDLPALFNDLSQVR